MDKDDIELMIEIYEEKIKELQEERKIYVHYNNGYNNRTGQIIAYKVVISDLIEALK